MYTKMGVSKNSNRLHRPIEPLFHAPANVAWTYFRVTNCGIFLTSQALRHSCGARTCSIGYPRAQLAKVDSVGPNNGSWEGEQRASQVEKGDTREKAAINTY